ncbi:MAG: zinc-ribbon domain-containing protein, partial [Oscillospiraceae bacterium]|nr:zinc-ribbon domain-containing protein [Oscillospiraceae bacterium]
MEHTEKIQAKCPKCGTVLLEDAKFCQKCGGLIPDSAWTAEPSNVQPEKRKNKWIVPVIIVLLLLAAAAAAFVLVPCLTGHDWQAATCTSPSICAQCGKSEGAPFGHKWDKADCVTAKT